MMMMIMMLLFLLLVVVVLLPRMFTSARNQTFILVKRM